MITLYRAPWSTNVERVALALGFKGLEAESVVIDYADRSPVVAASGQPLVPVIVEGREVVADSVAIMRHLDRRHPDPPLFPAEPERGAQVELFLDWFDQVWKRAPNEMETELEGDDPDHARVAELGALMGARLDLFEGLLAGGDHLFGELSAADFAAFPFLKYAAGRDPADDELFHLILDEHQSTDVRPRLAAWAERIDRLPRAA